MKWMAKQAWAGKRVINIGYDVTRLKNFDKFNSSFKTCFGELFYYNLVMGGKFLAFWSHRLYRLFSW